MGEVKLISAKEVLRLTGYKSRTTLWRRVRAGDFPKPIALSRQATRWKRNEVEAWINNLPEVSYGSDTHVE
ncbi:MAG: AlpA family phage regulatory protein [Henriciella sp.]|nr:AlpA family phage regulatory protein [Henriciella sp.]